MQLPVVSDTDFRAVHRPDRTGRERRSTGWSPGMWETLAVRAGASRRLLLTGLIVERLPCDDGRESDGYKEEERWRGLHEQHTHRHRPYGEGEHPHTNVRCTSRFWSRTPPLDTPSQFFPHPHTNTRTGSSLCIRGDARTNQHAENGRSMETSGVAMLPNALPGVAAPTPREGLVADGVLYARVCACVSG